MAKRTGRGDRVLLVGTAKGGFLLEAAGRSRWGLRGPFQLGSKVHDLRADPRDGRTLLMSATGGHLGPTLFRSTNRGRTWKEAERPPRFRKAPAGKRAARKDGAAGQSVQINLWLTPGHGDEPGVWYCGTSPQGLFRSRDGGRTWSGVAGINDSPDWRAWTGGPDMRTPEGAFLHSVCVDPRDPKHLYVSMSMGGTFESVDRGRSFRPLNRGVLATYLPDPEPEYGQDPHCMIQHPADPDRLFQQNHCGIYHLDRGRGETWTRIGRRMPKKVGDIGFPIVGHPRDADTVWVLPMDGTRLWPRTSPDGRPAVYRTRDGGRSWERQDRGLPPRAWLTVLRQAMDVELVGRRACLFFGTTSGEIWSSSDEGESWIRIAEHLPRIYSLRAARLS